MALIKIKLDNLTNSCFVIMPFTATFNTEYEKVIRPAVEAAGLTPVRADEIYSRPHVMQDIWEALRASRMVIAELTGKNTNVFYEVGLAHSLGKPVIIITRDEEDVPFDLKALRYRYYNTEDPFWGENLKTAIKDMIVQLLRKTKYGYVFEGISLEGDIKYTAPKVDTETPEIPAYDLTGIWQGTMEVSEVEYHCNLHLVQVGRELSGTLITSFLSEPGKEEQVTVVQEMMVGEVKNHDMSIHAISYSYLQQGLSSAYYPDVYIGKVSADGDEISGVATDEKEHHGVFSFKRVKAKQES